MTSARLLYKREAGFAFRIAVFVQSFVVFCEVGEKNTNRDNGSSNSSSSDEGGEEEDGAVKSEEGCESSDVRRHDQRRSH